MKTGQQQRIYRFSQAPIWELQRKYFEEQGIQAWQSGEVPQYITSNPTMAQAYAEIIFGFLRDRAVMGLTADPVYILELGAGSGRFAYHLMKALCRLLDDSGIKAARFCYIMSDLPAKNVAYWQQHRYLQPFVQAGLLDFAQFDAEHASALQLTESGLSIHPGDLQQPLLIVANYFFDSIPQELLYVNENQIYECGISLQYPEEAADLSTGELLESLNPEYHYRRAEEYEANSYVYKDLIELYRLHLDDSHFLFPAVGLSCLERLGRLSSQGLMLISADKGDHRLEYWEDREAPKLIRHGSFSLTANYHALQYIYERKGAKTLFTLHHYNHLNIGCILMLDDPEGYKDTRLAYRRFVENFGPDDFFSLKNMLDLHMDSMELVQLLAVWRLSGYDAQLFIQSFNRILAMLPTSTEAEMQDIARAIDFMWEGYYPIEEKHDLAFDCGLLLYEMDMLEEALVFFEHSLSAYDAHVAVYYNTAICHYQLGSDEQAEAFALQSLSLEPEHEGALALIKLLKAP
ncbi:SAM-dependent methyltransferase [Paenibacillus eucommiae]|uniref:Tetratricopeptide (TPR) repeat protein n=1 Tax=Paenibacillus eucommiae TaxID=1355755 RepID=A0ABS4J226_9BACL|nr:SAM-dependent methyltransferase [Paenibacillus eucommiae]MBP1993889.1 tetratricopeptide (TPR) repeat protein [Paenibacillus eucommiae]